MKPKPKQKHNRVIKGDLIPVLVVAAILIGVILAFYAIIYLTIGNGGDWLGFHHKQAQCGHDPYLAQSEGEFGVGDKDVGLVTVHKPHGSGFDNSGYYCSQQDAEAHGLKVFVVNGQSVH